MAGSSVQVVLGEHDRFRFGAVETVIRTVLATDIFVHEDYDPVITQHDIALLRMSLPVTFTEDLSPVCAPEPFPDHYVGEECVVSGWGITGPGRRIRDFNLYLLN